MVTTTTGTALSPITHLHPQCPTIHTSLYWRMEYCEAPVLACYSTRYQQEEVGEDRIRENF